MRVKWQQSLRENVTQHKKEQILLLAPLLREVQVDQTNRQK